MGIRPSLLMGKLRLFRDLRNSEKLLKNRARVRRQVRRFPRAEASSNGSTVTPHCSTITSPTFGFPTCFSPCLLWCILTFFLFSLFCYSLCCMRLWTACAAEVTSEFVVVHACLEETWPLLLPNAGLCADKASSALPHSVRSGACVLVARNTSLLVAKASVTQKSCSSPRRTGIQSRTFHCLRQTLPFRGTLVRHAHCGRQMLPLRGSLVYTRFHRSRYPPAVGQFTVPFFLFFVIVVHVVGILHIFKGPTRRVQQVRLFLCSFVLYMPWIPGEHRRGIRVVECVTAHHRGFEEVSE